MHSMTAFAHVQQQTAAGILCWEIRSVNHRYLDVSFRLPEGFRFLEPALRLVMKEFLSRGKVECQLKYQDTSIDQEGMRLNEALVSGLIALSKQLNHHHDLADDLTASKVLSWPGVIEIKQNDLEALTKEALTLFSQGLAQLKQGRAQEGEELNKFLQSHLEHLAKQITAAEEVVGSLAKQSKDKLLTRVQQLQMPVAEARLEQEIALLLTRLDVREELERLQVHLAEVQRMLHSKIANGRKLDFLMQELNRETNTLSAKADGVALSQIAVDMKVLIEQMREQIQNIE